MRRFLGAILLITLIFGLPLAESYAQNKKAPPVAKAPAIDSEKLGSGDYVGTLKSTPGSDRMFILEIEDVQAGGGRGGNPNAQRIAQAQQRLLQAEIRLQAANSPQQAQQARQQINQARNQMAQAATAAARGNNNGGNVKTVRRNIEFQANEKLVVRTMLLPEAYDDKGKPKKYTQAELAELKGKNKTLPGYEAAAEKLETGQKVRVVLATAPASKSAEKKDAVDAVVGDDADKKKQAKMIVILEEGPGVPEKGKKKK
jgi:hypothetical protein